MRKAIALALPKPHPAAAAVLSVLEHLYGTQERADKTLTLALLLLALGLGLHLAAPGGIGMCAA